jgi:DNA-binding NtrC family response regulator
MAGRLLIIDDEASLRQALSALFAQAGHVVHQAASGAEAAQVAEREPVELALLDLRLGKESGLDLLPKLKALRPEMSIIVVTALASIDAVVDAMKQGADNFVVKPVDPARLLALVGKGLEAHALRRENLLLGRMRGRGGPDLFAESAPMRAQLQLAEAVAARDTTVLILGETGTGKGVLARHLHERSQRAARPFVELNCAGLTRELTESELFGYEKGAFTGATGRKIGLFDAAEGGTLFLDEIGEMDLPVQAKLLQVIERRSFRRIGGTAEIRADVRLIAATHRALGREAAAGRFRQDLLFRLDVFGIRLPPLRERPDDVLPLARRFLQEFRGDGAIAGPAERQLSSYPWPGNVRELRNVMERAAILCPQGEVMALHLPQLGADARAFATPAPQQDEPLTLRDAERRFLVRALAANGGNIQVTARALGISRGTLYRKIDKYGIPVEPE